MLKSIKVSLLGATLLGDILWIGYRYRYAQPSSQKEDIDRTTILRNACYRPKDDR